MTTRNLIHLARGSAIRALLRASFVPVNTIYLTALGPKNELSVPTSLPPDGVLTAQFAADYERFLDKASRFTTRVARMLPLLKPFLDWYSRVDPSYDTFKPSCREFSAQAAHIQDRTAALAIAIPGARLVLHAWKEASDVDYCF